MSSYSQYGYYDPVESSQPQPTGYTHQTSSNPPSYPSAPTASGYGDSNQQGYGSSGYGAQSYGNTAQNNSNTSHAAAALSALGNQQDYNQQSNRSSAAQYDNSQWYGTNANTNNYGASSQQPPNRSQSNNSPFYASTQASTFGRLSVPEPSHTTSNTYGPSSTPQNAPSSAGTNYRHQLNNTQAPQNPPPRYNSPLHAVQAQQQSHQKQASRGPNHQPSPQMAHANAARYAQQNRQSSASVEPTPTTVDPSQVYDNRAELERKARFEAERRKKIQAEQAAKKVEEDRLAAEGKEVEDASREAADAAEAAKRKELQDRKNEQRRKAREEKRQSKSAATTLQQMASMGAGSSGSAEGVDEEAEMRAMFKKMREFNSKNPAMLAKLWEEERKQHSESQSPPAPSQESTSAPAVKNTHSRQSAAQAQPKSAAQPSRVPPPPPQPTVQQAKNLIGSPGSPQATARAAASPSGTSLWPPHKKGALADATATWLMGLPDNAGKTISQQAVLIILDSNPSYVQLCESLENLDMKFERSILARELLKAVPDGLRTQPKPATPYLNGSSTPSTAAPQTNRQTPRGSVPHARKPSGPSTVSYSTPLSLSDAARDVNQMHKSTAQYGGAASSSQQSPFLSQSQTLTNGSRAPSQARASSALQPSEVKPEVQPVPPPREPADKEEAARKRTFGDLVDLTADGESDDEGPPPKKVFQMPSITPPSNGTTQQRDTAAYMQQQPAQQRTFQPFKYQPKNQVPGAGIMNPPQRPPATIPCNHPIATQPAILTKPKGPSTESLQQSRMRGTMLVEPIMRDRVARKSKYDSSTIARDVLLATGRHPDMRGLNSHLNNMQKLLGHHGGEMDTAGTRCDLSTIRWDIIDPEQLVESVEEKQAAPKEVRRESSVDQIVAPMAPVPSTVDYEAPLTSIEGATPAPPKAKKKRGPGRPRLSDSAAALGERGSPRNATPTTAANNNSTPNAVIDPALLAHANDMVAAGTPVGYSAFRQIGPDGQVIKKKGRPVGWRKNVHSREAQGLPPHYPNKAGYVAGLGRPSKEAKEQGVVQPQWQSFRCEWQGCKAELQNLDTLKKHILKVHGRETEPGKGFECLWKGCHWPVERGAFGSLEGWLGHVHKSHLQNIAWLQGDGPRGGSLGESPFYQRSGDSSSPAYLNDAYGRSVTPVIEPTPPPDQQQGSGANPTATLPIHTATASKLEKDASAELQKLEEHKRIVGATMDRQGAVFASKERRATFLGDEDFEDAVEAEGSEMKGDWD